MENQLTIEYIVLAAAVLLLVSIASSKISSRLGIPALILFIVVGMLAGSEGPGRIYFDDAWITQFLGVLALVFILFSGGLDTDWASVKPVLRMGLALATAGVLITTFLVAWFATIILGFSWLEGILLGAIVSSTDAAAVFAVLRARSVNLRPPLQPLIEMESGSNDPMAVFLTIALTSLIAEPGTSVLGLVPIFLLQMGLGSVAGFLFGKGTVWLINRIRLDYEGLYPVLTLTLMLLTYGITASLHGSGFLAVYIAGLVIGNSDFIHKRSLLRFHDGMAWLMQIAMFLALGLLVFPSHIVPVIGVGILMAAFLIFIARPISVYVSLALTKLSFREKTFIGWVGLRGAVPIILATFPLLANIPKAGTIFNLVFFIVLLSVLLQGTTISQVADWLRVRQADNNRQLVHRYPQEYVPEIGVTSRVVELKVPQDSPAVGKSIMEIGLPRGALIVLIRRGDQSIVPTGSSLVTAGDTILMVADTEAEASALERISPAAAQEVVEV